MGAKAKKALESAKEGKEVNRQKYGELLMGVLPSVIETEEENERMLAIVEKLMDKGEDRSPEEDKLLELLATLVENFEAQRYPIEDLPPYEVLQELMREHGLRQKDLVHLLGSSSGTASEVINGKRSISRSQAKALAEYFDVSSDVFL